MNSEQNTLASTWLKNLSKRPNPAFEKWLTTIAATPIADLQAGLDICQHLLSITQDCNALMAAVALPEALRLTDKQIPENFMHLTANAATLLQKCLNLGEIDNVEIDNSFAQNKRQQKLLRNVLLEMAEDIRVIPILLCKRLLDMQTMKHANTSIRKRFAEHTIAIYTPLANRMGFGELKWQLEDLCLLFTQPIIYKQISNALNLRRKERDELLHKKINELKLLLDEQNINNYEVSSRAKHLMSIYKKMQRKTLPADQLYDTLAVRILMPTIKDCYQLLSAIHNEWPHLAAEFDDYIANPKQNGYRSIHTVIYAANNAPVEIQLRTFEMHHEAEHGNQAHWAYKEKSSTNDIGRINTIRQMLNWQQDITPDEDKTTSLSEFIFVFTPQGNIIELPRGATALDFAYHVHTQVGHRCRGAKVNGKLIALTHTLRMGDRVEIITGKTDNPSRDWLRKELGYITTTSAHKKIAHWFRQQAGSEEQLLGKSIWEELAHENKINEQQTKQLLDKLHLKDKPDLWRRLGRGELGPQTILNRLHAKAVSDEPPTTAATTNKPLIHKKAGIKAGNVDSIMCSFAKCCKPLPGDPIQGFITQSKGISVHRANCNSLLKLIEQHPERSIDVQWQDETCNQKYSADIFIYATDRPGVLRDVSTCVASAKINLSQITGMPKPNQMSLIVITINVHNQTELTNICNQLQQIPDVVKVCRESGSV